MGAGREVRPLCFAADQADADNAWFHLHDLLHRAVGLPLFDTTLTPR